MDPDSGRFMEVHTNQPGLQVYTSNGMPNFHGKRDATYGKHCAICFETQGYPNAINVVSQSNYPATVILG